MSPFDWVEPIRLEAAFLAALDDLRADSGGPVRTLRGVGAVWSQVRNAAVVVPPAILIRHAGWRPPTPGSGQEGGWSRWIATVVVGGGLAEAGRRAGSPEASIPPPPPAPGSSPSSPAPPPPLPTPAIASASVWGLLEGCRARLARRVLLDGCGPLVACGESAEPGSIRGATAAAAAGRLDGCVVWEQTWECSIPARHARRPMLACLPDDETPGVVLSHPLSADAFEVALEPEAAAVFAPGRPLLVAESAAPSDPFAAAACRSLGFIQDIENGVLRFTHMPGREYTAGSRLASPGAWFLWSTGRAPGGLVTLDSGTEEVATGDGETASVRLRSPRRTARMTFGPLPEGEIAAFRAWLDDDARGGLDPFLWIDERGRVVAARLGAAPLGVESDGDGLARLRFEVVLDPFGSVVS